MQRLGFFGQETRRIIFLVFGRVQDLFSTPVKYFCQFSRSPKENWWKIFVKKQSPTSNILLMSSQPMNLSTSSYTMACWHCCLPWRILGCQSFTWTCCRFGCCQCPLCHCQILSCSHCLCYLGRCRRLLCSRLHIEVVLLLLLGVGTW